jgi:hypothetical protein
MYKTLLGVISVNLSNVQIYYVFIKYFRNTKIKHGAILTYIYIRRVTACNICIKDNIYQTNKFNPPHTVNLKILLIMPLIKPGKFTERLSGDTEKR